MVVVLVVVNALLIPTKGLLRVGVGFRFSNILLISYVLNLLGRLFALGVVSCILLFRVRVAMVAVSSPDRVGRRNRLRTLSTALGVLSMLLWLLLLLLLDSAGLGEVGVTTEPRCCM